MTEQQENEYESILTEIKTGLLSDEEIKNLILEDSVGTLPEDGISEEWVNKTIQDVRESVNIESKNWKKFEDGDVGRLVHVFNLLRSVGIISLHNVQAWSLDDCTTKIEDIEDELNEKGIGSYGFCLYHTLNLKAALAANNSYLMISYGEIEAEEYEGRVQMAPLGQIIGHSLEQGGFKVYLDETKQQIIIPDFKWQLVYSPENKKMFSDDEVIRLMTNKEKMKETVLDSLTGVGVGTTKHVALMYRDKKYLEAEMEESTQSTVQKQLILRISVLEIEYYEYGFANWDINDEDSRYEQCRLFLKETLIDGTFSQEKNNQINRDLDFIKAYAGEKFGNDVDQKTEDRICDALERVVQSVIQWNNRHLEPIVWEN